MEDQIMTAILLVIVWASGIVIGIPGGRKKNNLVGNGIAILTGLIAAAWIIVLVGN